MRKAKVKLLTLSTLVAMVALALLPGTASAHDWCRFFGPVTINGEKVPLDTVVSAWLEDPHRGSWNATMYSSGGNSWYFVDVPRSPQGGVPGEEVYFEVTSDGITFPAPSSNWESSGVIYHPLRIGSGTAFTMTVVSDGCCLIDVTYEGFSGNVTAGESENFADILQGTEVTLTANDSPCCEFIEWQVDGSLVPGNPIVVTMDSDHTAVATCLPNYNIAGITGEVRCDILPDTTVTLYQGSTLIDQDVSDGSGNYALCAPVIGDYTVTAYKAEFREESQEISIIDTGAYTLDFLGETGLIPCAPSAEYAMDCVNHWLYPPSVECGLSAERAMDVVNAWLYPVVC